MLEIRRELNGSQLAPFFDEIKDEVRDTMIEIVIAPIAREQGEVERKRRKLRGISAKIRKEIQASIDRGVKFGFDAQAMLDGTETPEQIEKRMRLEKSAWADDVAERAERGEF